MRLLEWRDGDIHLTEDLFDYQIPSYAIFSHTWGDPSEEVTYKDVVNRTHRRKAGYKKIRFCSEQAAKDGLKYCWADSCCIDKTSSAELQEAVTSMFHWYQRAAKCYVHLADVLTVDPDSQWKWEQAFRASRWFTRGWTLQELLAPKVVEFFSRDGQLLGDKGKLESLILEITGVSVQALRGAPLSEFGIDERFLWARGRHTSRPEDEAYCLLGIFDVVMPVIYGERKERAVRRLKNEIEADAGWRGAVNLHVRGASEASLQTTERSQETATGSGASSASLGTTSTDSCGTTATQTQSSVRTRADLITSAVESQMSHEAMPTPEVSSLARTDTYGANSLLTAEPEHDWTVGQTIEGHQSPVDHVAFSPDGNTLVSASSDERVMLWDSLTGTLECTLLSPATSQTDFRSRDYDFQIGRSLRAVSFLPDGDVRALKMAIGSLRDSGRTILWNVRSRERLQDVCGPKGDIKTAVISRDGDTIASVSWGLISSEIRLWNSRTGNLIHVLKCKNCTTVAFSPDCSRLASGSSKKTITIWNCHSGAPLRTLVGHVSSVVALTFSPDGTTLASGSSDRTVRLWNSQTGTLLKTLALHTASVNAVAFSPDGITLASGSQNSVIWLWNSRTGKPLQELQSHRHHVKALAFAPDGNTLASGGADGTVMLWR